MKLLKLRYDVYIAPVHSHGPSMSIFDEICDFEIELVLPEKAEHLWIFWSKLVKCRSLPRTPPPRMLERYRIPTWI